jgi:hypothetical protein
VRWRTAWWGITIIADTPEEMAALAWFHALLPEKPESSYEPEAKAYLKADSCPDPWLDEDEECVGCLVFER